jgi:hypothetical protein
MMFFSYGRQWVRHEREPAGIAGGLPNMDWRDFDEFGVPSPCPAEGRPQTTERWIKVALENRRQGKDTGVTGGAIMGEVLACPSAPDIDKIGVALLDCHDVMHLDRLARRGTHGATQDILSWAAWQRVHPVDPQWRQDVIHQGRLGEMQWERLSVGSAGIHAGGCT